MKPRLVYFRSAACGPGGWRLTKGQPHTPFIDPRVAREHLADAERFDRLAEAFEGNPRIGELRADRN